MRASISSPEDAVQPAVADGRRFAPPLNGNIVIRERQVRALPVKCGMKDMTLNEWTTFSSWSRTLRLRRSRTGCVAAQCRLHHYLGGTAHDGSEACDDQRSRCLHRGTWTVERGLVPSLARPGGNLTGV